MSYILQPRILSELALHNIQWTSHGLMRETLLRTGCQMSPWVRTILAHQPQLLPQELELEEPSFRQHFEEISPTAVYERAKECGLFYTPFQVVASFAVKLARNKNFVPRGAEFNFGTDPNIGPTDEPRRLAVSLDEDGGVCIFGKSNSPKDTVSLSIPWYFCLSEPTFR